MSTRGASPGSIPAAAISIYLATDLGPFLLTLFPGVWALRRAAAARSAALFGAALPFALAPFLSLGGDAYEIGSILATRLPPWAAPAAREPAARGRPRRRSSASWRACRAPPGGAPSSPRCSARVWAFLTYALGGAVARALGQPATLPVRRGP